MGKVYTAAEDFIDAGCDDPKVAALYKQSLIKEPWTSPVRFQMALHRQHAEIIMQTWVGRGALPGGGYDARWRTEFHAEYIADATLVEQGVYGRFGGYDRTVTTTINGRMLFYIWCVLVGERATEGDE